jgi:hypothetical protein
MNLKDDDAVSAVALVVEGGDETAAPVAGDDAPPAAEGSPAGNDPAAS